MPRKVAISITLKPEILDKIAKLAEKTERSKSSIIEDFLEIALRQFGDGKLTAAKPTNLEKRVEFLEKYVKAIIEELTKQGVHV